MSLERKQLHNEEKEKKSAPWTDQTRLKLGEVLNLQKFYVKIEEKEDKARNLKIKELYQKAGIGLPLYYDTWRAAQTDFGHREIKDFRESKEYPLFGKQLDILVNHIQKSYLARQAAMREKDSASIQRELKENDFQSLLTLPERMLNSDKISIVEAQSSYSDSKRYLENILYQIETAPFEKVVYALSTLLEKEKGQTSTSLTVCSAGTRAHLKQAHLDLSGDIPSEALRSTLQCEAYQFINRLKNPPYHGMEIHFVAMLVNFAYHELGLTLTDEAETKDEYASRPIRDDQTVTDRFGYRVRITQSEAAAYLQEINSPRIIQSIIEKITLNYSRDIQSVSDPKTANSVITNLVNFGNQKDAFAKLHEKFFGYYRIEPIPTTDTQDSSLSLTEAQQDEINQCVSNILDQMRATSAEDPAKFRTALHKLCDALKSYPEVNKTDLPPSVLTYYEAITILLDKSILQELGNGQQDKTKLNRETLIYAHNALWKQYETDLTSAEQKDKGLVKAPEHQTQRELRAAAAERRLDPSQSKSKSETTTTPTASHEQPFFGKAKVLASEDDQLDPRYHYASLTKIKKEATSTTPVKTDDELQNELRSEIIQLMFNAEYLKKDFLFQIEMDQNTVFYFIPNCIESSWVIKNNTLMIPFDQYLLSLNETEQRSLFQSDKLNGKLQQSLISRAISLDCFKLKPPQKFDFKQLLLNEQLLRNIKDQYPVFDHLFDAKESARYPLEHQKTIWALEAGLKVKMSPRLSSSTSQPTTTKEMTALELLFEAVPSFRSTSRPKYTSYRDYTYTKILSEILKGFTPEESWNTFMSYLEYLPAGMDRYPKYVTIDQLIKQKGDLPDTPENNALLFRLFVKLLKSANPCHDCMKRFLDHFGARIDVNVTFKNSTGEDTNALQTIIEEVSGWDGWWNRNSLTKLIIQHGAKVNDYLPNGKLPIYAVCSSKDNLSLLSVFLSCTFKDLLLNKPILNTPGCSRMVFSEVLHDKNRQHLASALLRWSQGSDHLVATPALDECTKMMIEIIRLNEPDLALAFGKGCRLQDQTLLDFNAAIPDDLRKRDFPELKATNMTLISWAAAKHKKIDSTESYVYLEALLRADSGTFYKRFIQLYEAQQGRGAGFFRKSLKERLRDKEVNNMGDVLDYIFGNPYGSAALVFPKYSKRAFDLLLDELAKLPVADSKMQPKMGGQTYLEMSPLPKRK